MKPISSPDGYTVVFKTKVKGFPRPQITWFKQTSVIKSSTDYQMYYDEENVATLIIKEVFPEDAGTFTCVAKNSAGFASCSTELTVEYPLSNHGTDLTVFTRKSLNRQASFSDIVEGLPPTFTEEPKSIIINEGSETTVVTKLLASPKPEVKWYRNGKRITTKENITIETTTTRHHEYTSILKISKTKKTQEGIYKVVAKNKVGEASVKFIIKVETGEDEAPQILKPLRSTTVKKSDNVTLKATICGTPIPTIKWFKNNKPLPEENAKRDGDTYYYNINRATLDDTAEYTIKATNRNGTVVTTASVTVEGNYLSILYIIKYLY